VVRKNRATKPQNYTQKEDMITARQANGTGPYMLKAREPDVKTVLAKNPNWWGIKAGRFEGNADEVIYTPIVSDATRVAALLSGEVDLVNDPPPQDCRLSQTPNIKVIEGVENHRVHRHGPERDDVASSVKGRTRSITGACAGALLAIDTTRSQDTMRTVEAHRCMLPSPMSTTPRSAAPPQGAKALLAEAGYPNGFEVTLDCPNNRYVNDEKICQALAAMWAQIGVKVAVNAMPRATYFPKLEKTETSMYMLGWGGANTDAIFVLQPVLSTHSGKGDGDYNYGRYSNAKLDELTTKVKTNIGGRTAGRDPRSLLAHNAEPTASAAPAGDPWATRDNVTAVLAP
jgi:peptide/nickel transport system substrate-binding protein